MFTKNWYNRIIIAKVHQTLLKYNKDCDSSSMYRIDNIAAYGYILAMYHKPYICYLARSQSQKTHAYCYGNCESPNLDKPLYNRSGQDEVFQWNYHMEGFLMTIIHICV